jgi:hypothetical protein
MNSIVLVAAKTYLDSMKAMLHSHSRGFVELFQASTCLIPNSISLPQGLTNPSISLTLRKKNDSHHFNSPLKNYSTVKRITMNTCECFRITRIFILIM